MFFKWHFEIWKHRHVQRWWMCLSSEVCVWRIHAYVWREENCQSSIVQTAWDVIRHIGPGRAQSKMNLQTGLARLSTTWRVKGFNKSKGQLEKNLPQAILKLLGRTLPLMTGLKGQPGISGFVMNSTTWLGLLLPSELYAATWRRCRNAEINK